MKRMEPLLRAAMTAFSTTAALTDTDESKQLIEDGRARIVPTVVWVLVVSAVALRFAALLVAADPANPGAMEHHALAVSLLAGDGFSFNESAGYTQHGRYEPSSVQSPPYPLLLAGLYALFGTGSTGAYGAAVLINVFAAAVTVPILYLLVRRLALTDDRPRRAHVAGVIASGLFAIWPTQVYAVTQQQAVVIITLCFVTVAWLWLVSFDTGRLLPWIGYGVIGCFAALTEPVLLPAMALSGVWVLATRQLPLGLKLRNAIVLLACAFVIIGPWTWRNYSVHGTFMPIKSTFWVNVWKGNNATDPGHSGTDRPTLTAERLEEFRATGRDELRQYDLLTDRQRVELDGKSPAAREAVFGRLTRDWISNNPLGYAKNSLKRFAKTAWWDWDHPQGHQGFYVYPVSRAVLLVGSLIGLFLALKSGWRLRQVGLIVVTALLTYTLTVTAARFGMPMEPFQFALCGLGIATLIAGRTSIEERAPALLNYLGGRRFNDGK